ncbi:MAG: mechanosensitive ion channel [Deltaproteobacteria bacterium]|nr:mechanosensitive ion channel [Deltaproteobacteria bacterium]
MDAIQQILEQIRRFLEIPLMKIGSSELTLWNFLYLLILVVLLFYFSGKLRTWISEQLLMKTRMEAGARQAAGSIIRYAIIAIGLVIILQTAGIDFTALNVLAGAVGIGLGFGLQNIVNNFVSGLIILFEKPIKVGDRIEVDDVEGDVVRISGRSTEVLTNDNISIIIPNSKFITENVVNWSHTDRKVRFRIPVNVAYGSDVQLVERLLLQVAAENKDVLEQPAPGVRLMEFGDSGLHFELRAWSTSLIHRRGLLTSNLNFGIYQAFSEQGIEIPFPRRDIHILRPEREGRGVESADEDE